MLRTERNRLSFSWLISFYVQVMLPKRQEERNDTEGWSFNRAFGFADPDKSVRERRERESLFKEFDGVINGVGEKENNNKNI